MIWYFSTNIYHQWYDMIFLRDCLSSTIQYDNFYVPLILAPAESSSLEPFTLKYILINYLIILFSSLYFPYFRKCGVADRNPLHLYGIIFVPGDSIVAWLFYFPHFRTLLLWESQLSLCGTLFLWENPPDIWHTEAHAA